MNQREFEILNLLSLNETAEGKVAKPIELAQTLAADPDAPAMTDLMAVAAGTAAENVIAKVTTYCDGHPEYGEMMEQFRRFAGEEELSDPLLEDPGLGQMKVSDFDRARTHPPLAGSVSSDSLEHEMAASTGPGNGVWFVRRVSTDAILVIGDPAILCGPEISVGGIVRLDVPGFGSAEGRLQFSNENVILVIVHGVKGDNHK